MLTRVDARATSAQREHLLTDLDDLLRAVMQKARASLHDQIADLGLSIPVAHALRHLHEPLPMNALADRLGCDASQVTGIADRLEDLGLARREADPDDRRVKRLVRTAEGDGVAANVHRRAVTDHVFSGLGSDDLATLVALLGKVADLQPEAAGP